MSTGLLMACCCACRCGRIIQLWKRIAPGTPELGVTVEYPNAPCSITLSPAWQCSEAVAYSAWFAVDDPESCTRTWYRFKYTRSYTYADLSTAIRLYRVPAIVDAPTTDGAGSVGYVGKVPDGIIQESRRIDLESDPGDITCNVSPSPNWVPTAEDCTAWNVPEDTPSDWRTRLGVGVGYSTKAVDPADYPKTETKDIWVWATIDIVGDTSTYTRTTTIHISTTPTYSTAIDWPFAVDEIAFQATEDFTAFDPAAFSFSGVLSPDSFAPSWAYFEPTSWPTGDGAPFEETHYIVRPDTTASVHFTSTHYDADDVKLSLEDATGTLDLTESADQCLGDEFAYALAAANGSAITNVVTIYNPDGSTASTSSSTGNGQLTFPSPSDGYWRFTSNVIDASSYITDFAGDGGGSSTSGTVALGDGGRLDWTMSMTLSPPVEVLDWCSDVVTFANIDGTSYAGNDDPTSAYLAPIGAPYASLVMMGTADNDYCATSDEPTYGTNGNPAILRSTFPTGPQTWFVLQGCEDGDHSYWQSTTESVDLTDGMTFTNASYPGKTLTITAGACP